MLNNVTIQGRVAFVNYKQGEGDKKSFINFCVSWQSNEKEEGSKYYKEKLFRCKAFGQRADFIANNFPEKSQILVEGQLDLGNDYTNANGDLVKGGIEIIVNNVHFCGMREASSNSNPAPAKTAAPTMPKPVAAPAMPKPNMPTPAGIKPPMPRRA